MVSIIAVPTDSFAQSKGKSASRQCLIKFYYAADARWKLALLAFQTMPLWSLYSL